jgi:hypothetical protein
MSISLKRLIELDNQDNEALEPQAPNAYKPIVAQQPTTPGQEFNVGLDFTNFERTIAAFTENAKNAFQQKLMSLVGNKKVFLRGSKRLRSTNKRLYYQCKKC